MPEVILGGRAGPRHVHAAASHAETFRGQRQSGGHGNDRESACISNDPKDHVENASMYIEMGFDQIYFHSAGPDQMRFIEVYGARVLPALRQKTRPKAASPRTPRAKVPGRSRAKYS